MSPHCILTEPSLSPHDRKGREGKGVGRGREVGHPSIHLQRRTSSLWITPGRRDDDRRWMAADAAGFGGGR